MRQSGGSRNYYGSVHRFRFNAKTRAFELIGTESVSGDSNTGESQSSSCNHLTGACEDISSTPQEGSEQPREVKTRRKPKKQPVRRLEDVVGLGEL